MDRGKLVHISNETYMVFLSMEIELRKHLSLAVNGMKEKLLQALVENDDVQYHWSILAANWGDEAAVLLKLITEHWITIRGFSSVSAFLELYKQKNKRSIEKSKALRKNLAVTGNTTTEEGQI